MKQLIICLLGLLFFTSCKKLEQKDFYLDNYCKSCEKYLKKSAMDVKGIYYVYYEEEVKRLTVKYDPVEFKSGQLYEQLQKDHFIIERDSLARPYASSVQPLCCK
ncbi:MAG: heavy-metal-associated domain-containing protein [Flammeovirgaceae bacterium]